MSTSAEQSAHLLMVADHVEALAREQSTKAGGNEDPSTVTILTMALGASIARLVVNRGGDEHSLVNAAHVATQTLSAALVAQFAMLRTLRDAAAPGAVQ